MRRLILDLDGTLLDVRDRNYFSYRQALVKLPGAKALTLEEYWPLKRSATPWLGILSKSFPEDHVVTTKDLDIFRDDFRSSIETPDNLKRDVPHQGVDETLSKWAAEGVLLTLVTARMNDAALTVQLRELGWHHRFAEVLATKNQKKSIFLKEHFKVQNLNARSYDFWIGDTEEDFQSAEDLKIKCHLVANGLRDENFLRHLQPQVSASLNEVAKQLAT